MGRKIATLGAFIVISLCLMSSEKQHVEAAPGNGFLDPASTNYILQPPNITTGQERFFCLARGRCHFHFLTCPKECPLRKPPLSLTNVKACFADCSSRCETTCKHRIPNCNGYGSVCYDPRFVGGDGVMFYFHGANGGDFALVSDDRFQINVHFIGTRPEGRKRDFTWIQALSVMFDSHTLVIAARKVAKWDNQFDALSINWNGKDIIVPTDGDAEWHDGEEAVAVVERTGLFNSAKITILNGLIQMDVKVVPITEEDDKMHGYDIPQGDAFAHLETQFRFGNLTEHVEGILGQTYRPGYVSPVKRGVAMPMMGGEDRYRTSSLLSTKCVSCRFQRPITFTEEKSVPLKLAQA
ncbi:hypothetical protein LUZ63_010057 [Rhynchospora breviuscula]|uniref:Root cap n=1 Tax=Rhynchospora breviuscula TaxID=2022672 RepID=A0A9Q0HP87_9POAL|nr:hypothetical protein LUZ63_010057 [Rhynchospora breviuscula]